MNSAFGKMAFMALCRSPDWVRWHSPTNTYKSPLALNPGGSFLMASMNAAIPVGGKGATIGVSHIAPNGKEQKP